MLLLVAACGGASSSEGGASEEGAPSVDEGGPDAGSASPPLPDWTLGTVSAPTTVTGGPVPVITGLRTGSHPDFDRVTVALGVGTGDPGAPSRDSGAGAPPGAEAFPGYRAAYVDRPLHECGSGRQIHPVGDGWLELRLEPAAAHTEAGEPTLPGRETAVDGALLRRIYRTCDFEAVVTFVLAVSSPEPFRVFTLPDPPRVVVDVRR